MDDLMNLSRAARLAGVTRVELQKKIKDGVLPSFEGMVGQDDLMKVYPDLAAEESSAFEHTAWRRKAGFTAPAVEHLPNKEVLAARLATLGKELYDAQTELRAYRSIAHGLDQQLREWDGAGEEMQAAAAALRMWLHRELLANEHTGGRPNLAVRDVFLRIMASHVKFAPSGHEFFVDGNDTLLEAALRAGLAPRYGCSNGNCGKCKARVVAGEVLEVRPHAYALSEEEKASGAVLMCSCTAVSDVVVETAEAQGAADIPFQSVTAGVKSVEMLGGDMLLLTLQTPSDTRLRFLAGQNVVLRLGPGLSRELPVAGCPCDDRNLPFHIHNVAGNPFANHVATQLKAGDAVVVEGPQGDFVLRKESGRPLIFVAFGGGFAPLKSMLEQAMALDTAESMHLFWVASHEADLYFANWPRAMADALDNFRYTPLVAGGDLEKAALRDDKALAELLMPIAAAYPALDGADVYVAGPELPVEAARKWLAGHGVAAERLSVSVVR